MEIADGQYHRSRTVRMGGGRVNTSDFQMRVPAFLYLLVWFKANVDRSVTSCVDVIIKSNRFHSFPNHNTV